MGRKKVGAGPVHARSIASAASRWFINRLDVFTDRHRLDAYLGCHEHREFRPRRIPNARHVYLLLAFYPVRHRPHLFDSNMFCQHVYHGHADLPLHCEQGDEGSHTGPVGSDLRSEHLYLQSCRLFLDPGFSASAFNNTTWYLANRRHSPEHPQSRSLRRSVIASGCMFFFLQRTRTGKAILATEMDREAALLMGINTERINSLSFGIGTALVGVAGGLLSSYYYVYPQVGGLFGTIAFCVVALGGFGSIEGAFIAGILVGLAQTLGGFFFDPSYKYAIVFMIYLITIWIKPQGLMGW